MAKKFRKLLAALLGTAVLAGSMPVMSLPAYGSGEIETPEIEITDDDPVSKTVSLDGNGGALEDGKTVVEASFLEDDMLDEVLNKVGNFEKDGFVLTGWATSPDGADVQTANSIRPEDGKTYYAVWTERTKVTLNKKSATILVGKSGTLTATVTPKTALAKGLTWTSSNKKIATVSAKGVVKGIAPGTVTITAKAKDGSGAKATCKLTVSVKYVYECVKNGVYRYTTDTAAVKKLKKAGWSYRKAFRAPGESSQKVYQVYNKTTKRYRYTTDLTYAKKMKAAGHTVAFTFYQSTLRTVPVYEFSKGTKRITYCYASGAAARAELKNQGWKETRIAWYAQPK